MATREELITEQFAGARRRLSQQRKRGGQALQEALSRQASITGLKGGTRGAFEGKVRGRFEKTAGEAEAGLGIAESGARQQLAGEREAKEFSTSERIASQQFARGERLGSQEFAGGQAELDRTQRASQFGEQLSFQRESFAEQIDFQLREFSENLKTNFINASIALRDAGLDDPERFEKVIEALKSIGLFADFSGFEVESGFKA